MLRMEEVSKSYLHRSQVVKALDGRHLIFPAVISCPWSVPAGAARARSC